MDVIPKTQSSRAPVPVLRALRKLGHDIRDARRRRRIPLAILAERASISRMTLNKVEKGDPGVSVGTYATILFTLGMSDCFADVADPRHDSVGREIEEEHLPQRIHLPRRKKPLESMGIAMENEVLVLIVDAHPQGQGKRHIRIRPELACAS